MIRSSKPRKTAKSRRLNEDLDQRARGHVMIEPQSEAHADPKALEPPKGLLRRTFTEPLVIFLAIGLAVFLLERAIGGPDTGDHRIVVDDRQTERLQKLWFTQTRRPPSDTELNALVQDHIREEVLYREAIRLGLDRDDTIIRRRLAQKMGFLMDDTSRLSEPSRAELETFFTENQDRYLEPRRTSFRHVYVKRDRSGSAAETERIAARLAQLPDAGERATQGWRSQGDPFMLQKEYAERSDAELGELFGGDFVDALAHVNAGEWTGAVESAYGHHAVFVVSRTESRSLDFEAASSRVQDDYVVEQRRRVSAEAYDKIRDRYEVEIDAPLTAATETQP